MVSIRIIHVSLELWGGIFCLIAALCMFLTRNFETNKRKLLMFMQLSTAVLLFMDALAWAYRGVSGTVGFYMVRISNFMVFFLGDLILLLYHLYLCDCLFAGEYEQKKIKRIPAVCVVVCIGMLLVIVSQFTGLYYSFNVNNFYHRNAMYPLSLIIPLLGGVIDFTLLIQYRKKVSQATFVCLLSYMILPMLAIIFLFFFYGISLVNIAINISMIFMFIVATVEQSRELNNKEKEMCDMKIALTLSQIGPHFIFNTLSTIRHLCIKNPQLAAETVDEFTTYLRGNIDSLINDRMIYFEKELKHVQSYLAIEKKRFGERVNVVYDIKETDFMLPALSMQIVVENAVKHGICKKAGGGTVMIRTERHDNNIYITIEDSGVGFDPENLPDNGRTHAGIANVRSRLENMCHGRLEIESMIGSGTKVRIILPECYN